MLFILYRLKITNDMGMRYYMYDVQSMKCMNTKTANFHFQKNHLKYSDLWISCRGGAYRSFRSPMRDFSQIHWMQVVPMEYRNSPLRTFVTKDWIYVLCEAISSLPAKACILTQFSQFILWLKMAAAAPSDSAAPRRACDLAPRNTKSEWFWDIPKDPKRPGKNKWLQYNEHFKEAKFGDISMYSQFFVESFANSMQFPHFSTFAVKFPDSQHPKVQKLPVSWRKWSASWHGHCSD